MDLFTHAMHDRMQTETPLAARMRPRTLEEFFGQEDIVGPGKLLRRTILFVKDVREALNRMPRANAPCYWPHEGGYN